MSGSGLLGGASVATAIDLAALARLVRVSITDLADGARCQSAGRRADGALASAQSEILFEADTEAAPEPEGGPLRTALLSVAARPSALDRQRQPKLLTKLGGEAIIRHVVKQLALGGVTRIVIVLGAGGGLVRAELAAEPKVDRLAIEYVDLGESYTGGFACSLLAARDSLGSEPFLLCTCDHIFDPKLVSLLRKAPVDSSIYATCYSAVTLIETGVQERTNMLPLTAVRVRLRDGAPPNRPSTEIGDEVAAFFCAETPEQEPDPEPLVVSRIGRNIGAPVHGIEAGLYACAPEVFDALEAQRSARAYFTLAQAMDTLAARGELAALTTGGRDWFAIETADQLQVAIDAVIDGEGHDERVLSAHFPWQVRIARADSFSSHPLSAMRAARDRVRAGRLAAGMPRSLPPGAQASKERLVLALSAAVPSLRMMQDSTSIGRPIHTFSLLPATPTAGYEPHDFRSPQSLIHSPGQSPLQSPAQGGAEPAPAQDKPGVSKFEQLAAPLLSKQSTPETLEPYSHASTTVSSADPEVTDASETVVASLAASYRQMDGSDGDAALSIELPHSTFKLDRQNRSGEQMVDSLAYLVNSEGQAPLLAVPESPYDPLTASVTKSGSGGFWQLPSAVTGVRLVAIEEVAPAVEGDVEATAAVASSYAIAVEQSVPIIGWVLLAMALVCSSFAGALTNLMTDTRFHPPPGDLLRGSWRAMATSLTLLAIQLHQNRGRSLLALTRLSRPQMVELVAAGVAMSVNLGAFQSALVRTSIAHAATFESMSSLWLVLGEVGAWLFLKGPPVSGRTIGAVLIGCFGATLCFNETPQEDGPGHPATPFGDALALSSGVGAGIFLISAENLRHALEPVTFLFAILMIYGTISGCAAFIFDPLPPTLSMDPCVGFLGWLTPSPDRLPLQLTGTLVVDVAGYLAYVAVMKYVPALMVSAAMLLGPFVSTLEGVIIGVEDVPGLWTVGGAVVITMGSAIIAVESQSKTNTYSLGDLN